MKKSFVIKGMPSDIVVSIDVNEAREIGNWARAVDCADWIMSNPEIFRIDNFDEAMDIAYEARESINDLITGEDEERAVRQVIKNRRENHEK